MSEEELERLILSSKINNVEIEPLKMDDETIRTVENMFNVNLQVNKNNPLKNVQTTKTIGNRNFLVRINIIDDSLLRNRQPASLVTFQISE